MASAVWKGQLTFGLISVPVRLYRAARKERIPLHYLREPRPLRREMAEEQTHPDQPRYAASVKPASAAPAFLDEPSEERQQQESGAGKAVERVQQTFIGTEGERPIPRERLLRGYEVAPEQYVAFSAEELRRLRPPTSAEMQILRTVRLAEIDPVYFETSYYVLPGNAGERPYALLFAALRNTEYVALAKMAMHGREHILIVRPGQKGLLAHTMYYNDEIRAEDEFKANVTELSGKEIELATAFISAIAGPFEPEEFKDTYRESVQNAISSKMENKDVRASGAVEPRPAAPVVNILEALKKSLDLAKKSGGTEDHAEKKTSRRPPGKVTELKNRPHKRKA